MNTFKKIFDKNRHLVFCLFVLFIYLFPNIFMMHQVRAVIHDNLDSTVVWQKTWPTRERCFHPVIQ